MLHETQTEFAAALIFGDTNAALKIRAGKLTAMRRLEIYRHNVMSNLRGVLKDIYPVIFAIVGDTFFLHAADQFIRSHPSHSGDQILERIEIVVNRIHMDIIHIQQYPAARTSGDFTDEFPFGNR